MIIRTKQMEQEGSKAISMVGNARRVSHLFTNFCPQYDDRNIFLFLSLSLSLSPLSALLLLPRSATFLYFWSTESCSWLFTFSSNARWRMSTRRVGVGVEHPFPWFWQLLAFVSAMEVTHVWCVLACSCVCVFVNMFAYVSHTFSQPIWPNFSRVYAACLCKCDRVLVRSLRLSRLSM